MSDLPKTKMTFEDYKHPEFGFRMLLGDELADDIIKAAGGFENVSEFMRAKIVPLARAEREKRGRPFTEEEK
jgi:hypothetical protein